MADHLEGMRLGRWDTMKDCALGTVGSTVVVASFISSVIVFASGVEGETERHTETGREEG